MSDADVDGLKSKIIDIAEVLEMDTEGTWAAMAKKTPDGLILMHYTLARQLQQKKRGAA